MSMGNKDDQLSKRDKKPNNSVENVIEHGLLESLDEGRRSFLKRILISSTYITPSILSLSIGDLYAKKKPTKVKKKHKKK
jgi:hypothetical protein